MNSKTLCILINFVFAALGGYISSTASAEGLSFEPTEIHQKSERCTKEACAHFDIRYLRIVKGIDAGVAQKINSHIEQRVRDVHEPLKVKSIDERARNFLNEFDSYLKDAEAKDEISWDITGKMDEVFQTAHFLSLQYTEEGYAGGAHGFHKTIFLNFDLQNGEVLQLDDILGSHRADLMPVAENAFRKSVSLDPKMSLTDGGFFYPSGAFSLSEEWTVSREGLRLYYNEYEVASYAQGPADVLVEKKSIGNYLSERWKELG